MARRVDDREHARGLNDDRIERAGGKPRVERQRDRARAHRPEEEFDELRAISDQHGNALARRYAEPGQHARDAVHALVELPIGRAAFPCAEQIDDRNLVRQARHGLIEEKAKVAPTIHVVLGRLTSRRSRQVKPRCDEKATRIPNIKSWPNFRLAGRQIRSPYSRLIMGVSSFTKPRLPGLFSWPANAHTRPARPRADGADITTAPPKRLRLGLRPTRQCGRPFLRKGILAALDAEKPAVDVAQQNLRRIRYSGFDLGCASRTARQGRRARERLLAVCGHDRRLAASAKDRIAETAP